MNLRSNLTTSRANFVDAVISDVSIGKALTLFFSIYRVSLARRRNSISSLPVLKQLSLEQLMDVDVTSVAKKEQKVGETAAAIFVITQEDIRRSGVTSIPEALRLAPGVEVSQSRCQQMVDRRARLRQAASPARCSS